MAFKPPLTWSERCFEPKLSRSKSEILTHPTMVAITFKRWAVSDVRSLLLGPLWKSKRFRISSLFGRVFPPANHRLIENCWVPEYFVDSLSRNKKYEIRNTKYRISVRDPSSQNVIAGSEFSQTPSQGTSKQSGLSSRRCASSWKVLS